MLNESLKATQDYFFAATYRKHDAITVPAFQRGAPSVAALPKGNHKQVTQKSVIDLRQFFRGERDRFQQLLTQDIGNMSVIDKLGLMLKYSFSKLRFEPDNNYKMHSAVPSPRSIFPIGAYIQINIENYTETYRYDDNNHHLVHISKVASKSLTKAPMVSIMLVAELEKIVPYYGDFSAYLIGLESGHLHAQLSLLSQAIDLPLILSPEVDTRELLALKLNNSKHLKLMVSGRFTVDNLDGFIKDINHRVGSKQTLSTTFTDIDYDKFPILKRYFDSFYISKSKDTCSRLNSRLEIEQSNKKLTSSTKPFYTIEQLINIHEQRTSGNDKNGLIALKNGLSADDFEEILQKIITLKTHIYDEAFSTAQVAIYLSITSIADVKSQTLCLTNSENGFQVINDNSPVAELQATALSPIGAYNYDDFSCVLSFSVNLAECIQLQGNLGAQKALIEVGHLAQLCIAVMSEYSLFARPIKALDEAQVESMVKTQDSIIYQLICGVKVANQIQYRMA